MCLRCSMIRPAFFRGPGRSRSAISEMRSMFRWQDRQISEYTVAFKSSGFLGVPKKVTQTSCVPKKPEDLKATVYSEICLSCHRNMLRISEIAERDLPGPLKKAGLIMEHRKHMEAFQKRGKGEGCTTCHATVVHAKPYKGYKIVIPRGHIKMDELPKAEQVAIEAAMVKAHREGDCFRCHDGKTEYEGKVLSRKCLTCHIDEKLEEYLF